MLTVRFRALAGLLAVLALGLLATVLAAPAGAAKTVTISITADGPKPASATAAVGDTIVFRNDDATFIHQARSASDNWSFDTRPLAPGQSFTVGKLTKPGDYRYAGANLDDFTGRVLVPAASSPSAPAPRPGADPPSSSPPPGASAAPSPTSTGGSGAAQAPGFSGLGPLPTPSDTPSPLAPQIAPALPGQTPTAAPSQEVVLAQPGRLPSGVTVRAFGLPAALTVVGIAGVASLLVRLLLAQPTARPRRAPRRTA